MARHPRWVRAFLGDDDLEAVRLAVASAESGTSAEIRLHLDHRCPGDPITRAIAMFERLGMHRTAERHGVLLYIAVADRKLAVIGDQGIHARVGEEYWQRVVADVLAHLRDQRPRDGLLHAVAQLGRSLHDHFPRRPDDTNELSDQISLDGA